jgi:NADH:ubiquinone oxidoreductase subunit 6 (subunit J)
VGSVVFFLASGAAIASALAVVLQRNPFVSAIALIGHLASLATLYILLEADFVAAAQVIVYAGAVMVMFLFVIAYIGPHAEVAGRSPHTWQTAAAVIAGAAILVEVALVVGQTTFTSPASPPTGFGSPQAIGASLLTTYVGSFEIVSLLLLIGAIAAVVLGAGPRPTRVVDERDRRVRAARDAADARTGEPVA